MRSSLAKLAAAAVVVAGLVGGHAFPASAWDAQWVHGLGVQSYLIPGPPPGPPLGLCHVSTALGKKQTGDWADLVINDSQSYPESCLGGWVEVVTWSNGQLNTGPQERAYEGQDAAMSVGPVGWQVFGANYNATNAWGYSPYWNVTIF